MKKITVLKAENDWAEIPAYIRPCIPVMRKVRFEESGEEILLTELECVTLEDEGYEVTYE